jgi:hypothetical protein
MADIEGMVDSIGLGFFCNLMVECLYYFGKNGEVSEKLEINCKRAISELESLKWPLIEKTYPDVKIDLFRSNRNIDTFEQVCEHYKTPAGQMIGGLITNLKYILSENSLGEKLRVAEKLQSFFDDFGDFNHYAVRDCVRDECFI